MSRHAGRGVMFPKAIIALERELARSRTSMAAAEEAKKPAPYIDAIRMSIEDYGRALDVLRHADGEIRKLARLQGKFDRSK